MSCCGTADLGSVFTCHLQDAFVSVALLHHPTSCLSCKKPLFPQRWSDSAVSLGIRTRFWWPLWRHTPQRDPSRYSHHWVILPPSASPYFSRMRWINDLTSSIKTGPKVLRLASVEKSLATTAVVTPFGLAPIKIYPDGSTPQKFTSLQH